MTKLDIPDYLSAEKVVIPALYPHLDAERQHWVDDNIEIGEYWMAMTTAIEACYFLGKKIPEELMQLVEQDLAEYEFPGSGWQRTITPQYFPDFRAMPDSKLIDISHPAETL